MNILCTADFQISKRGNTETFENQQANPSYITTGSDHDQLGKKLKNHLFIQTGLLKGMD